MNARRRPSRRRPSRDEIYNQAIDELLALYPPYGYKIRIKGDKR